jgi:hypothetical protein
MARTKNPAPVANAANVTTAGKGTGRSTVGGKTLLPARKKKGRIAPVKRASKANHAALEKEDRVRIVNAYKKKPGDWRTW